MNPPAGWNEEVGQDGQTRWRGPHGELYDPASGWLQEPDGSTHTLPLDQFEAAAAAGEFNQNVPPAAGNSTTAPAAGGTDTPPSQPPPDPSQPVTSIQNGKSYLWVPGKPPLVIGGVVVDAGTPGRWVGNGSATNPTVKAPSAEAIKNQTPPAPGTLEAAQIAQINQNIKDAIRRNDLAAAQIELDKGKALGIIDGKETLESVIQRGNLANSTALANSTIATNAANVANQKAVTLGFDASGRPILATMDALGRITMPDGTVVSTLARDLGEANSRREDEKVNLARQQQSWDQWMKERADTEALAQQPQSWLQYAARGTQLPQGVGLFDQLNAVNQGRPMTVDAFLSSPAGGGPATPAASVMPPAGAATTAPAGGTPAAAGAPPPAPAAGPAPAPAPNLPPVAGAAQAAASAPLPPLPAGVSALGGLLAGTGKTAGPPTPETRVQTQTVAMAQPQAQPQAQAPGYKESAPGVASGDKGAFNLVPGASEPGQPDTTTPQGHTPGFSAGALIPPVYDGGGIIPHYHDGGYVPKYDKGGSVPPLGADGDHSLAILQAGEIVIPRHLVEAAAAQIKGKKGGAGKKAAMPMPRVKQYDQGGVVNNVMGNPTAGERAGGTQNPNAPTRPGVGIGGGVPGVTTNVVGNPTAGERAGGTATTGYPLPKTPGVMPAPAATPATVTAPTGPSSPSGLPAPAPGGPRGVGTAQRPLPTVGDVRNIPWLPPTLRAAITPGSWNGSGLSPYRLVNQGGFRSLSPQTARALPPSFLPAVSSVASMTGNFVQDQPYLPPLQKVA